MPEKRLLSNIQFVLVEPKGDRNIGSTVRILSNFGFSKLILVDPVPFITTECYRAAASSCDMLDNICIKGSLIEAISDSNLVVSTTGKKGKSKKPVYTPWEVAELALSVGKSGKVSIVFGREDRGLENRELRYSHILSRIPTSEERPSLNLSHAVGIYAYEIYRSLTKKESPKGKVETPGSYEELEGFYEHLKRVLDKIGYVDKQNPERIMDILRRLFGRLLPTSREIRVLRGILRKIENKLDYHER